METKIKTKWYKTKKELEKEIRELKIVNRNIIQNFKESGIVKSFYGLLKTNSIRILILTGLITFLLLLDGIKKIFFDEWVFAGLYIILVVAWGVMFYVEIKTFKEYKEKSK